MRRFLLLLVIGVSIGKAVAVGHPLSIKEGVDYDVLTTSVNKTAEPKGKVNVKEIFSFVCVHCRDLEPLLEKATQGNKSIDLQKIHAVWDGADDTIYKFAKLSATFEVLKLNNLYVPAFTAIFNRENLTDKQVLANFLQNNHLSAKQQTEFMQALNSFSVDAMVKQYGELTNRYNISGTPTFIIADKYEVRPAQPQRLIEVVNALVAKVKNGG